MKTITVETPGRTYEYFGRWDRRMFWYSQSYRPDGSLAFHHAEPSERIPKPVRLAAARTILLQHCQHLANVDSLLVMAIPSRSANKISATRMLLINLASAVAQRAHAIGVLIDADKSITVEN